MCIPVAIMFQVSYLISIHFTEGKAVNTSSSTYLAVTGLNTRQFQQEAEKLRLINLLNSDQDRSLIFDSKKSFWVKEINLGAMKHFHKNHPASMQCQKS